MAHPHNLPIYHCHPYYGCLILSRNTLILSRNMLIPLRNTLILSRNMLILLRNTLNLSCNTLTLTRNMPLLQPAAHPICVDTEDSKKTISYANIHIFL